MKAVICTTYGPPEVLKFIELPKPQPKDNEICIQIKATTVAVADSRIRGFRVPAAVWIPARIVLGIKKPKKPVLGVELAGEIESVGKNVTRFKIGDKIFAATLQNFGAHAEYICLSQEGPVAIIPKNMSLEEATALPIGARTAMHFLERGKITKGQKVLIYGASGSVGTYAVQLAKHFGADVTGVCSHANMELVRLLGADKVLDYTDKNFRSQLETYDMVFVAVDKFPFSICKKILSANGVYVNCTNPIKSLHQIFVSLTSNKKILMSQNVPEKVEYMVRIKELVEQGILKPVIDKVYPFQQIVEAHRYVDQGHKVGNVIITIA